MCDSTIGTPIRGKLPDRLISAFGSQDIEHDLPGFTVRLVNAEPGDDWEEVADLGNRSVKCQQTA